MPVFQYTAVNARGETIQGRETLPDATGLLAQLERSGLFLVSSKEIKPKRDFLKGRLKDAEILEITANLKSMVESGITLLEAIDCLAKDAPNKLAKKTLSALSEEIASGTSFSKALQEFPDLFPPLYIHTVAVGEQTGNLPYVLGQMTAFYTWKMRLKSDVQQAMIYPAFLFSATLGVVTLLMTFVIPRFSEILKDMNTPLPPITLAVMGLSHLFVTKWPYLLAGLGGLAGLYLFLRRAPASRFVIDGIKLDLPVMGGFLSAVAISRFVKNLMISYAAGVEILTALELTEKTIGNSRFERAAQEIREQIRIGGSLTDGIRKCQLFPRRVVLMIEVGERTGKLGETLAQIGAQYDELLPRKVNKVMAIMEPVFLLVNAAIVLAVALAVILPIYSVNIMGRP